jgi:hypothetical protein
MRNTLQTHGLLPIEEAIMDAWDEGLSLDEIAARVDRTRAQVFKVVGNFSDTRSDRWHLPVPAQTDALLAAIARAHPERMAA